MKLVAVLTAALITGAAASPCPPQGDSKLLNIRALDVLKNRPVAPSYIDNKITLEAMLASGDDTNRFQPSEGATITGYIVSVKRGGLESCNCHSKVNRDWHVELSDTPDAATNHRVIVEITPRLPVPVDRILVGKKVSVTGWMFFDSEHKQNALNTNPKGTTIWRATAWEIHPVNKIE